MSGNRSWILSLAAAILCGRAGASSPVVSLDGEWLIAADPGNAGREAAWWSGPAPGAKRTKVPWIIQDAFPGYHGVAWYWRDVTPPAHPCPGGRYLLRFWAADYLAEVWLNGVPLGGHEGGETPFVLDATRAVRPGAANRLAVRVLNPTDSPIDGIVLAETPHRNKVMSYGAGASYNHGGITDSVELILAPPVRVDDLFASGDPATGAARVRVLVHSDLAGASRARIEIAIAPGAGGEALAATRIEREIPPGETPIEARIDVPSPRPWDLGDPFLYRATARAVAEASAEPDERSVRFGFRRFELKDGYFRLNGRRLFLRSSHTGNHCPAGLQLPHDPDLLRRDLLNVKVMGFNAIRFIAGVAARHQLDLADEIGLLVYEESYAGWLLGDSPQMPARFDRSVSEMILRDRSHPSIVIWGLLNETPDGPVFRHAAAMLPLVRSLDDTRAVLLNSGRWDAPAASTAGISIWRGPEGPDPNVTHNGTGRRVRGLGITWDPGRLAFHPGRRGEYSVVRWTAPEDGEHDVRSAFAGIAEKATTDVHVLKNGAAVFDAFINVKGSGNAAEYAGKLRARAGETVDFACGFGNGDYGGDTTGLSIAIRSPSRAADAARDFTTARNPNGPWSYGVLRPPASLERPAPDASTFTLYPAGGKVGGGTGSLSNPGSLGWEDVLSDQHPYQRVPHTAEIVQTLRTLGGGANPLFLSEYGIGSAVDLPRAVRSYERIGKDGLEDARFYRARLEEFLDDWRRWRMSEAFARPEDFFAESLKKMAGQRLLGINAIRSNPSVIGYSLTGTVDQGMTGEGLFTTFRELKPGTVDAVFEGLAPLRLCLFAEPVNAYRGTRVRLEAVLANEDALAPGEYPLRLDLVGPGPARILERTVSVKIPERRGGPEPPFAMPVFAEEVTVDGPQGRYRFVAAFEKGAAAAGGEAEIFVADARDLPSVEGEVVLWGEDAELERWLASHAIRARKLAAAPAGARELILASSAPPAPGGAAAFRDLAGRIARGSAAVFLSPSVFRRENDPAGWLPLARKDKGGKGSLQALRSWLYLKDEWAKSHPIFEGLPAGGLLDTAFYRELIPDLVFSGQDPPAEAVAGANNAAQGYSSGLLVAVHELGAGRFILNTLLIRENLGRHPAADRLLLNLLRYAARGLKEPPVAAPADLEARLEAMGY